MSDRESPTDRRDTASQALPRASAAHSAWITRSAVQSVLSAWSAAHGIEPCGLLLGTRTEACVRIEEAVPLRNAHPTPDRAFRLHPDEQLEVQRRASARGLSVVGAWHGHLRGGPFPGWQDQDGFEEASRVGGGAAHSLLIAGRGTSGRPVLRAFAPGWKQMREIPLRS